jgi:RNA polymerase sigma factor (sigma-70 family)
MRLPTGLVALWLLGGLVVIIVVAADISEYWLVAAPVLVGVAYLFVQSRLRAAERTRHEPAFPTEPLKGAARRGERTRRAMQIERREVERRAETQREAATDLMAALETSIAASKEPPTDLMAALEASIAASKEPLRPEGSSERTRATRTAAARQIRQTWPDLTGRERDLLVLVYQGMSYSEIADALHLPRATVEVHLARLIHKLRAAQAEQA